MTRSQPREVTATFQDKPKYTLSVTKTGTGSGTVSSNIIGISCGAHCEETLVTATVVKLNASPAAGGTFAGWPGVCSGTQACSVTLNNTINVTASFNLPPCIGDGSSAAGLCCNGLKRCPDGFCRRSCPAPCIPTGSNTSGTCRTGAQRCSDGYCKFICPAPCDPKRSNAEGICCRPAIRVTDGYCKLTQVGQPL